MVFGVAGACRKDELSNLTVNDLERHGELLLVKLPTSKNKTPRSFTISNELLDIVTKYEKLRPTTTTTNRLFLCYRNGHCINQVVGKNTFGAMPKKIATYLGLEDARL